MLVSEGLKSVSGFWSNSGWAGVGGLRQTHKRVWRETQTQQALETQEKRQEGNILSAHSGLVFFYP